MQAFKEGSNLEVRKYRDKVKAVKPNQALKQKVSSKKNVNRVERLKKEGKTKQR